MGLWAESFQVCLFDMRRGQEDGHELDKILFFSPSDLPLPSQLSVVGLSEGLITFTKYVQRLDSQPDRPTDRVSLAKSKILYRDHDVLGSGFALLSDMKGNRFGWFVLGFSLRTPPVN